MIKISVVVPTYNRPQYVEALLEALLNQTFKDFEVIISDDGSKDSPYEVVKKFDGKLDIKYIWQRDKKPFNESEARNLGIKIAFGEILVLHDDDSFLHRLCLENHYKKHQAKGRIMVWGALYFNPTTRVSQVTEYMKNDFPKGAKLHYHRTPKNFSIRREEVLKINGFDQDFCGHFGKKDTDFTWRLKESGVSRVEAPECEALAIRSHSGQFEDTSVNSALLVEKIRERKLVCANGIMDLRSGK